MLVLVTNREDLTADWLVLELERRGQGFVRLCTEDYPSVIGIDLHPEGAALAVGEEPINADEISAVWWRRSVAPVMPQDRKLDHITWAAGESHVGWLGFWGHVDAHWVNRPEANAQADCKPVQLQQAMSHGLHVPPTLITNRLESALDFQKLHKDIVCKSMHSGVVPHGITQRSLFTQRLDSDALASLDVLGPEPYLLQAFIDKIADIRVTVIGHQTFACRIDSQQQIEAAVDWRQGRVDDLQHDPFDLDDALTERLVALVSSFGLRFAAIDLVVDQNGDYVFLEVNPNGQWAWIEQLTGQPIASALVDELVGPR